MKDAEKFDHMVNVARMRGIAKQDLYKISKLSERSQEELMPEREMLMAFLKRSHGNEIDEKELEKIVGCIGTRIKPRIEEVQSKESTSSNKTGHEEEPRCWFCRRTKQNYIDMLMPTVDVYEIDSISWNGFCVCDVCRDLIIDLMPDNYVMTDECNRNRHSCRGG